MVRSYGAKVCIACRKDFIPRSGVQRACSEACRAEARAKGLMAQRGRRKAKGSDSGGDREVGEELGVRVAGNGQGSTRRGQAAQHSDDVPELELDLTPMEDYIRALVQQEVRNAVRDVLREQFQEILK